MEILDFNHCTLPKCKCGWNVIVGGQSEEELKHLKKVIKENFLGDDIHDTTDYSKKVNQEKF